MYLEILLMAFIEYKEKHLAFIGWSFFYIILSSTSIASTLSTEIEWEEAEKVH